MSKPYEDMTIPELEEERAQWESVIANATGWGASIAAADGFRRACIAWIGRRRLEAQLSAPSAAHFNDKQEVR